MKLRKIFSLLIVFVLLNGCSSGNQTPNETSKPTVTPTPQVENFIADDKLIKGDFSNIAGDYINTNNETITINDEGLREHEHYNEDDNERMNFIESMGIYQMSIYDESNQGYTITVYPIGIKVEDETVGGEEKVYYDTDITKVRLSYGQCSPMSVDEIYTKVSE